MPVSFVSSLDKFAEFFGKGLVIKEMVDSKSRPGGLPRVRRTDTPLRSSNTVHKTTHMNSSQQKKKTINSYLDLPSSTSLSPSTIWWKSKTSWARSEMNSLFAQSRPWDCNSSSSLKKDGRCTTRPFPISPAQFGFTKPMERERGENGKKE